MAKVIASKPTKITKDPEGPWIKHSNSSDYKIFVNESFRQSLNSKREVTTASHGKIMIFNKTDESSLISPVVTLSGSNLVNIPNKLFFLSIHPNEGFIQNYNFKLSQPPLSFQTKYVVNDDPNHNPEKLLLPGKTITLSFEIVIVVNRPILYLNFATPQLEGDPLAFDTSEGEISETKGKNDKNEDIVIKVVNLKQLNKGDRIEIKQKSKLKLLPGELFFGETRISYICESPFSNLQLATTNSLAEISEEIEIERQLDNLRKWNIKSRVVNESVFPITINNVRIYSDRKLKHEHILKPAIILDKNKDWSYKTSIDCDKIEIPELSHNVSYSVPAELNGKYEGFFHFLGYNIDIKQK
jgi:hypothetical protein